MSEGDERLVVLLEARIAEFEKRMSAAERRGTRTYTGLSRNSRSATRQMEADMVSASARINQALATTSSKVGVFAKSFIGGLAGGAVVSILGSVNFQLAGTVRALAEVGDQAKRAGVGVEAFQELRYVAEQNRIPIDALTDGLKEMNLRLDEFIVTGAGPAAESLARMGYSAEELKAKLADPSALLLEMIGRMEGLDKAAQIRVADEVFGGTAGERFVELLALGEDGIQGQIDRARELGLVIEEDQIAKAAELDAKFAEVGARITTMWQSAVVGAAEFFGFVEDQNVKFFRTVSNYEAVMEKFGSVEAAAAMAGGWQQLEAVLAESNAVEVLDEIAYRYDALQDTAGRATSNMAGDIQALADEYPILSEALASMSSEVDRLSVLLEQALNAGDVEAAQAYSAELGVAVDNLEAALISADNLSALDLSGAVAAAGSLASAFDLVAAAARAAWSASSGGGMDTGTPLSGDVSGLMPPSVGGVTSSPRPRAAPPMLGETGTGSGGGRGGGGGGGGGSRRIEALLADLQTEREVLDAWYVESLELLTTATDAQLEALGGRHEAMERLEAEHLERMRGIREEANGGILGDMEGFFGGMASLAKAGGDRTLKITKAAAIAQGTINSYLAFTEVLKDPSFVGRPWARAGAAMAALGQGLGAVASIRSGGGGMKGAGGGGGGTGGREEQGRSGEGPLRVLLEGIKDGQKYEGRALREMFDALAKEAGDRGLLFARSAG
jgi:hypothetical protein